MSNIVQILINLIPKLYRSVNPDRIFVRGNEVDITAFEKGGHNRKSQSVFTKA
jgi:hypothetical protein